MNIIDLFAGCGGMSLGFKLAGFNSVLASEIDLWAGDTFTKNHPNTPLIRGDIREIQHWEKTVHNYFDGRIDGVVGGPPCQGFSLSGNRDPHDPRNSLFMDFVKCVKELQPMFFVMENVTGLLSMKTALKEPVLDIIISEFDKVGYRASHAVLNAAWFGVPQLRERVFIIGLKKELPYSKRDLFPRAELTPDKFITVDMAISDLPPINSGEGIDSQDYATEPQNSYQAWARENASLVYNHIAMRHTQRLVERFKVIKHGQSVADVSEEHSALKRGNPKIKSGKVFGQNNMRVYGGLPSPTVAASYQSNFIHPRLHRNFTAREGARLQSFPDCYVFQGKRTTMSWEKHLSQYQQIGNAVPPLLAKAIGLNLKKYFSNIENLTSDQNTFRGQQIPLFPVNEDIQQQYSRAI
jgi:DNA (cytosine-5)-methyltransferase 1